MMTNELKKLREKLDITYEQLADWIEQHPLKETPTDRASIETTIQFLCYLGFANYQLISDMEEVKLQEIYDHISKTLH